MKERVDLKALERFTCLAEQCPESCCRCWPTIVVDADTVAKWKAAGAEGEALLANTRAGDDGKTVLALDADRTCLNLGADGLCTIQSRYGHDWLSEICREYPRLSSASALRDLNTAQLSCPEVVRLVLFDSVETTAFSRKGGVGGGASPALLPPNDQVARYLDGFVTAVLAERKFPLNVRLYFIAQKLAEMAMLSAEGRLDEGWFQRLQSGLRSALYDINVRTKNRSLGAGQADGGVFWRAMYDLCVGRGVNLAELAVDDSAVIRALTQAAPTEEGFASAYGVARKWLDALRVELRTRFPGLFERYLTVSLMNKGFPWNPVDGNFVATFLNAVLPLAMVQLILSARLAKSGELDDAYIQKVIYRVEREMGHSWRLVEDLFKRPVMLRIDQYLPCFLDVG